jgi:hypothetical protein
VGVALELDDDPQAVPVRLVADVADALETLVADQVGNLLQQLGLVYLVGDLGDDDHLAIALAGELLDGSPGPHHDPAAAGPVAEVNARPAVDVACRREVGALHAQPTCFVVVLHELIDGELRVAHQAHRGIDHLAQVVGRDVGGHAHGDAARPVDQQVRNPARQNERLTFGVVEVWTEGYGFFFDIREELRRESGHPDLGVPHRCGGVAVDRAEVPLPVDERVPHGEILRHANQRIVDRAVAVRVVLAQDVTDDAGALSVRTVPVHLLLVHRVENAPVNRFEAVPHVRNGSPDDDAHRVIEVRAPHLVFEGHRLLL